MNAGSSQSLVLEMLVRMVVPMRREFGRVIDVQTFLHDQDYARDVLAQAASSQVERLRTYAEIVDRQQRGAGARPPVPPTAVFDETAQRDFLRQRHDAVRSLIDLAGPSAESLAIRMERAKNAGELRPLLERGYGLVLDLRGASAARAYVAVVGIARGAHHAFPSAHANT